jgi:uncharacterized Zn-finger protein
MNAKPAPEVIQVPANADEVVCDGGSGALGHPQVYYTFDNQAEVMCGYCGRIFTKKAG